MADATTAGAEPPAEKPKYDQKFFLGLAAQGKVAWNKWRLDPANNGVRVTFAGVDFSQSPLDEINFEGFEFGDQADFSRCKWRNTGGIGYGSFAPGRAIFTNAAFGDRANFSHAELADWPDFACAHFGSGTNFTCAVFGGPAVFQDARFRDGAFFIGADFRQRAIFKRATFGQGTRFVGAAFDAGADFTDSRFDNLAMFASTAFGFQAVFARAVFRGQADFTGAAFGALADFAQTHFEWVKFTGSRNEPWSNYHAANWLMEGEARATLEQRHKESWAKNNSGPDHFLAISFVGARFDGEANFSSRSFDANANFTDTRFNCPPDFDGVNGTGKIDFTGAHISFVPRGTFFEWTRNSLIPVRLRALRKIAEETKNHDLERDLYIEERKAERGVYLRQRWEALKKEGARNWPRNLTRLITHILWIGVMAVYWALADYGRSFVRPAAWLIASGFFFYLLYLTVLTPIMAHAPDIDKYKQAVRMLALGNTVPFVGPLTIDSDVKKILFCPSGNCPGPLVPPEGYQLLVLSQNLLSIILVFFIGLALRNYFKIK